MLEAAHSGRQTGDITTPVGDDADLLGVNHFHNVFESYFDILFPDPEVSTAIRKQKRQNVLYWAKAITAIRNAIVGHPGN